MNCMVHHQSKGIVACNECLEILVVARCTVHGYTLFFLLDGYSKAAEFASWVCNPFVWGEASIRKGVTRVRVPPPTMVVHPYLKS